MTRRHFVLSLFVRRRDVEQATMMMERAGKLFDLSPPLSLSLSLSLALSLSLSVSLSLSLSLSLFLSCSLEVFIFFHSISGMLFAVRVKPLQMRDLVTGARLQ